MLEIPFIGNSALTMGLAADKQLSRAIAINAGIRVPEGIVVNRDEPFAWSLPAVVKPATADNSQGVSLVRTSDQWAQAVQEASRYSDRLIIEQFIPLGREVRCGILERDGELMVLPLQEYHLQDLAKPIRDYASKLTQTETGTLDLTSKYRSTATIVPTDDPISATVGSVAKQCFVAFGCRDYGLFDFRIDPSQDVYFLEAGLYCSFAPKSIITSMVEATGERLEDLYRTMIDQAIRRDSRVKIA